MDWRERYERDAILWVIGLILWRFAIVVLKFAGVQINWIASLSILGILICIYFFVQLLLTPEGEK